MISSDPKFYYVFRRSQTFLQLDSYSTDPENNERAKIDASRFRMLNHRGLGGSVVILDGSIGIKEYISLFTFAQVEREAWRKQRRGKGRVESVESSIVLQQQLSSLSVSLSLV